MGIVQDVYNALKAFKITKIDGQLTDDDINKLTTQLTAALVTISTGNGGGKLGHIGIAVPVTRYVILSTGPKLDQPIHPGAYVRGNMDSIATCILRCAICILQRFLCNMDIDSKPF